MDDQRLLNGLGDMNVEQLKALIRDAARDAIREELATCGLIATTPAERGEAQADFVFLRFWRRTYQSTVNKIGTAVIMAMVGTIGTLLAIGFNAKFGK